MGKTEKRHYRFGLVGRNISYSFSQTYFSNKFSELGLDNHSYENFDLPSITGFIDLLKAHQDLKGLNVTIPYKEAVIPYLQSLDPKAREIGAVNTIRFRLEGPVGHNTDAYGFRMAIQPLLQKQHTKVLILGTGGASKAVAYVLGQLGLHYTMVSRTKRPQHLTYDDLDMEVFREYQVLVNCTPLGTYPTIDQKPGLPYHFITESHLMFDLIYNPPLTAFLQEGKKRGATISNGLRMLQLQAEKAWELWNTE